MASGADAKVWTPDSPPVTHGYSWRRGADGRFVLPDRTLGWDVIRWTRWALKHPDGKPWTFTPEQARLLLWLYALDDAGRFRWTDAVLQRLKGWGKDPFAACVAAIEFVGPCRPDPTAGLLVPDLDGRLHPVGRPHPSPWVQVAAVSKDQTRNTMTLFPSLFTDEAIAAYAIDLGKEIIYAHRGAARIEAVTSSPRALEGGRPTFVIKNETHHWLRNNEGHEMADVIERNAVKSADGQSRSLSITNAYDPAEDSVAQREREAWEAGEAGTHVLSGILYDSLEAPPEAPLTPEAAPHVIRSIRGDSVWLDVDRIVASILDARNAPSRSRRFWYNQITATEDAWLDVADWDLLADRDRQLALGDELALFFDGSKSDDATGLVACRISDGFVVTLGMWQRPPGDRGIGWTVPRSEVDALVSATFEKYRPVCFYGDPSHTRDDVSQERFWDGLLDEWHRRYGPQLPLWAVGSAGSPKAHAVTWDMTSPERLARFTAAAERTKADVELGDLAHDGDPRMRLHVRNAKRYANRYGESIWKGHREGSKKIDLAVCAIGARMARRDYLNSGKAAKRQRTGRVSGA